MLAKCNLSSYISESYNSMNENKCVNGSTASSGTSSRQSNEENISCTHVKQEVKTEKEVLLGKRGGYLCPICAKHFFIVDYFVEHMKEYGFFS